MLIRLSWALTILVLRLVGFRVDADVHRGSNPCLNALAIHPFFRSLWFLSRDLPPTPARGAGALPALPLLLVLALAPLAGCFPMPGQPVTAAEAGVAIIEYVVTTPDAEVPGVAVIAPGEWATTGTAEVKVRFRPAAGGFPGAVATADHGTPEWECVVYESEGQVGAHTRTRSGMPDETVLVEVLGAREIPCSQAAQAPEAHCLRVPVGDVREEGERRAWLLLHMAGPCPGRAG